MMTGLAQHIIIPKLGISKRLFGAKHHATLHAGEQEYSINQFSPPFHTERGSGDPGMRPDEKSDDAS